MTHYIEKWCDKVFPILNRDEGSDWNKFDDVLWTEIEYVHYYCKIVKNLTP
jgi:hypothetical protein